jgi:hypothetical protein
MSLHHDHSKRDGSLPNGCKDLIDALRREQPFASLTLQEPPITQHIALPDTVSVRYLAEITEQSVLIVLGQLSLFGINPPIRTVCFEIAAKFLRKYGIMAYKLE